MDDIFVYCIQLPTAVRGVVEPDENGDYTIYINSLYNAEQQREIYEHEMRHIRLGHHRQTHRPIAAIEAEARQSHLHAPIRRTAAAGLPPRTRPAAPPPASRAQARRRLARQALTGTYY